MKKLKVFESVTSDQIVDIIGAMIENSDSVQHYRKDVAYDIDTILREYYTDIMRNEVPIDGTTYRWIVRDYGTYLLHENNPYFSKHYRAFQLEYSHFQEYQIIIFENEFTITRYPDYNGELKNKMRVESEV